MCKSCRILRTMRSRAIDRSIVNSCTAENRSIADNPPNWSVEMIPVTVARILASKTWPDTIWLQSKPYALPSTAVLQSSNMWLPAVTTM